MPTADDAPWQPWTPRVGQRVRVCYRGECPIHDGAPADEYWFDGLVGTVLGYEPDLWPECPGHDWTVRLDIYDYLLVSFAAAELEPLDAAP